MTKLKYSRSQKLFLSDRSDEDGSIIWHVDLRESVIDSCIRLRDCNKCITLDFDAYGITDLDGRLAKVEKLIQSLQDFHANFRTAASLIRLTHPFKKEDQGADKILGWIND